MKTSPSNLESKSNIYRPELDLLRGLAAIFMIVNHTGLQLLSKAELSAPNLTTYFLDLTSYAPVIFFFASGVGSGTQSISKSNHFQLSSVLYKFGLLLIADLFFSLGNGRFFGLDFLGFIGLSVLLLELVRCSRKPIFICVTGIILIFAIRYIIGPKLNIEGNGVFALTTNWLLGSIATKGVSYPFSPWFTYPLLGYIFGVTWVKSNFPLNNKFKMEIFLIAVALFLGLTAFYLYKQGFSFFRWGTVGIGFYVLSFAVIFFSILTTTCLHNLWSESRLKLFYLGGTASLAIVPIHYLLIHMLKSFLPSGIKIFPYLLVVLIVLPLCFFMAKGMNRIGNQVQHIANHKLLLPALWSLITLCGVLTYHFHVSSSSISITASALGQLLICLLFSARLKRA